MNTEIEPTVKQKPWNFGRELQIYVLFQPDTPQRARVKIHKAWPVHIPGFEAFTFYVHKFFNKEGHWSVTEAYSGMSVANGNTRSAAAEHALETLQRNGFEKVRMVIHEAYKKYGYIYNHRLIEVNGVYDEIGVEDITSMNIEEFKKLTGREENSQDQIQSFISNSI